MLRFENLSLSQMKCVVALLDHTPSLKKTGVIAAKELHAIDASIRASRTADSPKIGYPNWLFKTNKISAGLYQLPLPTEAEFESIKLSFNEVKLPKEKVVKSVKIAKKVAKIKELNLSDSEINDIEEFNKILRENGIEV